jgi:hypothetical protein
MADKITIGEINIDMDKALADGARLKQNQVEIKAAIKALGTVTKENSAEYVKLSAELKNTNAEYRSQEKIISDVVKTDKTQLGTIPRLEAANAKLRAEQRKLNLETKEGAKRNAEINKKINENSKTISKNSDERKQNTMNIGNYSSALGSSGGALSSATGAAKTFGMALKVMLGPIGLIIAAIAALTAYFKRSEEGQNKLAKITAIFSVVLENILDVIGKVGEALVNAFTKPKESLEKLKGFIDRVGQFFKDTFGNVIGGSIQVFVGFLQKAFANVGLAWQKFKNIFVDNSEKINKAQEKIDEYNKKIEDGQSRVKEGANNLKTAVVSAYNSAKKSLGEFIDEQKKEIDIAKRLADQQANLDKLIRKNTVETAKEQLQLVKLRNQIEDKNNKTAEERLRLLDEENELLKKQSERHVNIAQQKYDIKKAQNALSASTKEDLAEEAQLLAEVFSAQSSIEAQQKRSIAKRGSIENEIRAEQAKTAQSAVDQMQYELDKYILFNKDKIDISEETANRQIEILNETLDIKINEIDARENLSEQLKNVEKQKLLNDHNLKVQEISIAFEESERARKLEALQTDWENEMILAEGNMFAQLDLQKRQNDLMRAEEIKNAKITGAEVNKINEKYNRADEEIEKAKTDAKLSLAQGFASNIATIAGENTEVGKSAAVAAATINTYQAATGAYAALAPIPIVGPVLGVAAAGAAIASGLANVKKILSVNPNGGSSAPSTTPRGDISVSPASAPSSSAPSSPVSSLVSSNTEIGNGIISRNAATNEVNEITPANILVVDKVTDAQKLESQKATTATL